ncbi:hypothetical protein JCM10212_002902 [Sporobolomyces blumeae]
MERLNAGFDRVPWNTVRTVLDNIVRLLGSSEPAMHWAHSVGSPLEHIWAHQSLHRQNGILSRLHECVQKLVAQDQEVRHEASFFFEGSVTVDTLEVATAALQDDGEQLDHVNLRETFREDANKIKALSQRCRSTMEPISSATETGWDHLSDDQRMLVVIIFETIKLRFDLVEKTRLIGATWYHLWIPDAVAILETIDDQEHGVNVFANEIRALNSHGHPHARLHAQPHPHRHPHPHPPPNSHAHSLVHYGPSPRQRQIYGLPPV